MKTICSFLLLLVSFCGNAQNCIDTAYKANYHVPNSNLTLYDQQANSNGEYFITGSVNLLATSAFYSFVSKFNGDGTIAFSKKISIGNFTNYNVKNRLLILQNGHFLIAGNDVGYGYSLDSTLNLIKFDSSGNILYAKKYFTATGAINPITIKEGENSSVIVSFNYVVSNFLEGSGILKIDSVGNIIWTKIYASNFISDFLGQSFSILNGCIYFKGIFHDPYYPFQPSSEHRIFLAKIDLFTGNIIDSKSYNDIRFQDDTTIIYSSPILNYSSQVTTSSNQIFYTDRYENAYHSKFGSLSYISDTNLNFIKATYFSLPNSYRQIRITANKEGEIFNYGNIYSNGILSKVFISKFDSAGNKEREIGLNYTTAQYLQSPVRPISLIKNYLSVFNTYVQGNATYLQLYKFPADVPISECYGRDTSLVTAVNYTITPVHEPFLNQATPLTLSVAPLNVTLSPLGLISEKQCTVVSNCNLLKINPSINKFCSFKDTFNFSAHKNVACNKNVLWQIDTAAYSFLQVVTDTTVRIKFKQAWSGYLYSKISSCDILKDSVFLNVYNTPDSIGIGNDTSLCATQTMLLQPKTGYADYLWENGSTTATRLIQSAGQYSIIAHDYCNNTFYDTINVRYFQPVLPMNLGNDTTLCNGNTLQVQVGAGFKNIQWQDASTNQSFTISNAGKYFVTATDSCANILSDTINVKYYINRPPVNLGADITACKAQNYFLNAGAGYKNYRWQDGSTNNSFIASGADTYYVDVTDSCGNKSTDSLIITAEPNYSLNINYLKTICINDTVSIKLSNIFSGYSLAPTNSGVIQNNIVKLFPAENTTYTIKAFTAAGCTITDTILIKLAYCSDVMYFPSAFTPNGDKNNDYYSPLCETTPSLYELRIYNRFGQNIFTSNNFKTGWDGKLQSVLQNTGTFAFTCKYQLRNKALQQTSGSFLLIR